MDIRLDLRFDGLDADAHQLDMKLLGRALVGLDRALSAAMFMTVEHRLPVRGDRYDLVVKVGQPHAGCYEIPAIIGASAGVLPIALDILKHPGSAFLFELLSFMLKFKGGKQKEADANLMEAYRLLMEDRSDERSAFYADAALWRAHSVELVRAVQAPLREIVSPLGATAETFSVIGPPGRSTVVDVAMAQAIRSRDDLEVGDMEIMHVRVDGLTKHSRTLKVEMAGEPGRFINAEVRDPAFENNPNAYMLALAEGGVLEVSAKPTFKNGELFKLHIMDAKAV